MQVVKKISFLKVQVNCTHTNHCSILLSTTTIYLYAYVYYVKIDLRTSMSRMYG